MYKLKIILKLLFIAILAMIHVSAGQDNVRPKVSMIFPDFSATTMNGSDFKLSNFTERGAVVVIVLRGFPGKQCPVCTTQVAGYIVKADEFEHHKIPVVFIYPGEINNLDIKAKEFTEPLEKDGDLPSNFIFVIDQDYKIINLLGLRWDLPGETAYPAAFIIDHKGHVQYANISDSHQGRAMADEIIEVLEIIN